MRGMCNAPDIPQAEPVAPPTAIEPPKARGEGVQRAGARFRDRIRSQGGRRSTILTAPIGGPSTATTTKTLLGS